jgi:serine/threonine-protein kinase
MASSVNNTMRTAPAWDLGGLHRGGSFAAHPAVCTVRPGRSALSAALPAYEIGSMLGRGTFGVVFDARHIALGRGAAIKQLWPDLAYDAEVRMGFATEARLLAALDHPNVVRVYDYVESSVCALVLERMRGGTLRDRLRKGPIAPHAACQMTVAVLRGLEHAHQRGVLHRDVTPRNLLLGEDNVLKLADFGVARALRAPEETDTARQPGTPAYMAPEQIDGSLGRVSPATDVWAVGAILYEMLAGRRPFAEAGDIGALLYQRITAEPRPLTEIAPHIRPALAHALATALARLPSDRFQTATAFAACLERCGAGHALPRRAGSSPAGRATSDAGESRRRITASARK